MGVGQKPKLNVYDVQALVQSCIKTRNDSGVEIFGTGTFLKTTCLWTEDGAHSLKSSICDAVGMLVAREICICSEVPLMQKMKYAGLQAT